MSLVEVQGPIGKVQHPRGAVGVIVAAHNEGGAGYRVRFPDGFESILSRDELAPLAEYKLGRLGAGRQSFDLRSRVIYRCIVGSRAFGLEDSQSDTDRRGIFLPPAELDWSLFGVPDQWDDNATQEAYWELQKFLVMALKANPNVLECLYTPLVEVATPLAQELLELRGLFLSRVVFLTGIHLMRSGEIEADLKRLNDEARLPHVADLLARERAGPEQSPLPDADLDRHRTEYERLQEELRRASRDSALPEAPRAVAELNDFLVRVRLSAGPSSC